MKVVLCSRFSSKEYAKTIRSLFKGFQFEETLNSFNDYYKNATEHFYFFMVNALNEKMGVVQLRVSTAPRIRYFVSISELREHLLRLDLCELPFLPVA